MFKNYFNNKKNQFTIRIKVDFISNISYKYDKNTEFEIEWKRGTQKGTLENIFLNQDGEIKPKSQFLIPCTFIKKTVDSDFASKTLSITLKKIEHSKKKDVSIKIATLKIDVATMANKDDPTLERQYSSTMKGILDDDFKPYIEFKASVAKGLSIEGNDESDIEISDSHESSRPPRRDSISSPSPINSTAITTSTSYYNTNSNNYNSDSDSNSQKVSPPSYPANNNDLKDPFDFQHESTPRADFPQTNPNTTQVNSTSASISKGHSPTKGNSPIDEQILQYETTKTSDLKASFDQSLIPCEESINNNSFDNSADLSDVSLSDSSPETKTTSTNNTKEKEKSFFNNLMKKKPKSKKDSSPNNEQVEKHVTFDKNIKKRRHSTPTLGFFGISKMKEKESKKQDNDTISSTSSGSNSKKSLSSLKSSIKNLGSPLLGSPVSSNIQEQDETFTNSPKLRVSNNGIEETLELPSIQSVLLSRSEDFKTKYLTEEIILMKKPEYIESVPVSSIVLYKCLFEWKQFHASNSHSLSKIIETLDYLSKRDTMDRDKSIYWLSSCYVLKFLLERSLVSGNLSSKKEKDSSSPTNNFSNNSESQNLRFLATRLSSYQRYYWKLFWNNLKIELEKVLERTLDIVKQADFEQTPILLNYLLSTLEYLEKRLPFQSLWAGVFKQIFFYTSTYLCNRFFSDSTISNSTTAVNLKLLLSTLSQWFNENKSINYFYYYKIEMNTLLQVLDVLVIEKNSLRDEWIRKDICPSLTSTQLAILLSTFTAQDYKEEIDPSVIKELQDDGIRKHEIQGYSMNCDIVFDLSDNPDSTKNIFEIKLPSSFLTSSQNLSSSMSKNLKFLSKTTPIY